MSVKIMSQVYDSDIEDIYDHSVMMALANHCDDRGVCYPSMSRIARLARVTERGCRKVINRLIERGMIVVEYNAGPRGTNIFTLHLTPGTECPPEPRSPGTPPQGPRNPSAETPEPRSPEPSGTVNRTVSKARGARAGVLEVLCTALSKDVAEGFIDHRKQMRKALTKRAAELIVDRLAGCPDPDAVVNESVMNGWQGVFPEKGQQPHKTAPGQKPSGPKPVWQQVNERAMAAGQH